MRRTRSAWVVGAVALVGLGVLPGQAGAAPSATPGVAAATSPSPGDQYASPGTDITLRGVTEGQASGITVTGSASGQHPGALSKLTTEVGVSFDPATDLQSGEQVTVTVPGISIEGGNGDSFTFTVMTPGAPLTAEQTAAISAEDSTATPDASAAAAPGCTPTTVTPVSRPDLGTIPGICTTGAAKGTTTDKMFATSANGQAIYDVSTGQPVWFHSAPNSIIANFESFTLGGKQVFAYYEGSPFAVPGSSTGVYRILDSNYNLIHTVKAGNGYQADLHELQLTDQGTALIGIYQPIIANTSSVGGPPATIIVDYVVQEVELDTGNVKFEWHSIDHVKVSDSHQPQAGYEPWDWIHGNSIQKTSDGNYLVSGRHTWATYKINGKTGALIWTLGGRSSNFGPVTAGQGVSSAESKPFCWQHDFRQLADGSYTMFDNASAVGLPNDNCGQGGAPAQTRGLVLNLTPPSSPTTTNGIATVAKVYRHTPEIPSGFAGSFQTRSDGSRFMGYGGVPQSTLYAADGSSQLEVAQSVLSYRAFLQPWSATPSEPPAAAVKNGSVYASWNGATNVAAWQVLAGPDAANLAPVGGVQPATGFETQLSLGGAPANSVVRVQALDANGAVIGASATPVNGTTFLKQPNAGTTVGPGQLTATSATTGTLTVPDLNVLFFYGGFVPTGVTLGVEPAAATPSGAIPVTTSFSATGSTISFQAILRLKDISVLGISLAGFTGPGCATSVPADVTLSSPGDARTGSPLTATYTVAPFANCQGQEQTVSSLLSGTGNTLSLKLG